MDLGADDGDMDLLQLEAEVESDDKATQTINMQDVAMDKVDRRGGDVPRQLVRPEQGGPESKAAFFRGTDVRREGS